MRKDRAAGSMAEICSVVGVGELAWGFRGVQMRKRPCEAGFVAWPSRRSCLCQKCHPFFAPQVQAHALDATTPSGGVSARNPLCATLAGASPSGIVQSEPVPGVEGAAPDQHPWAAGMHSAAAHLHARDASAVHNHQHLIIVQRNFPGQPGHPHLPQCPHVQACHSMKRGGGGEVIVLSKEQA